MPSNHDRQCDCLVVVAPAASICATMEAWTVLFSRSGILGNDHSADRSLADPAAPISHFSAVLAHSAHGLDSTPLDPFHQGYVRRHGRRPCCEVVTDLYRMTVVLDVQNLVYSSLAEVVLALQMTDDGCYCCHYHGAVALCSMDRPGRLILLRAYFILLCPLCAAMEGCDQQLAAYLLAPAHHSGSFVSMQPGFGAVCTRSGQE